MSRRPITKCCGRVSLKQGFFKNIYLKQLRTKLRTRIKTKV